MLNFLKRKFPRFFIPNGLLSYSDLCIIVELGIIDALDDQINGASIDVTLDNMVCVEDISGSMDKVKLADGETIKVSDFFELDGQYYLMPNAVMLASTLEWLEMPPWLSAEYSLKSSIGRSFLSHQIAGSIDPCFSGRVTLELKNETQFHKLILSEGMRIGKIKFFKHAPVPRGKGYDVKGRYNCQHKVTPSKGIR